jgi:predicted acyl esterase
MGHVVGPDTDFVARLVDVYPDGRSINLTDEIVRARYRDFRRGEAPTHPTSACRSFRPNRR